MSRTDSPANGGDDLLSYLATPDLPSWPKSYLAGDGLEKDVLEVAS
jgi:hypothetical protein